MGTYRENTKQYSAEHGVALKNGNRVYCPTCGHSMLFYYNTPKLICTWCGHSVYNINSIGKKAKFHEKLKKQINKQKQREREENKDELKNK